MFFYRSKKKIGLVLGGGAARGISHVGVIKALCQHDIPIDFISGTSIGSLVGGLYAATADIELIIDLIAHLHLKKLFLFSFSKKGVYSFQKISQVIEKRVGRVCFRDLKIPFQAVATNIVTGMPQVLCKPEMPIIQAIEASCAFPGIFVPIQIGCDYFVDGGVQNNLPVDVVRAMGAEKVIAVDILPPIYMDSLPDNLVLMMERALDLLLHQTQKDAYRMADIVLTPIQDYVHSFDLDMVDRLIGLGEASVLAQLSDIRRLVRR